MSIFALRTSKQNLELSSAKAKALITEFDKIRAQAGEEIVVSETIIKAEEANIVASKKVREQSSAILAGLKDLLSSAKK